MLWASSRNGVLSELKEWCSERIKGMCSERAEGRYSEQADEGTLSERMKVL